MAGRVRVIAIDGPAAAGKTVVGRALAQRLGFKYLDTGIMYRAVTWLALQENVPVTDEAALERLAETTPIRLKGQDSSAVLVGQREAGPELRQPAVDASVSLVSRISAVRRALVRQQREIAAEGQIVMVGRDIGTVVLPRADLKLYMTASPEVRARRRWLDLQAQGHATPLEQVLAETERRDALDSQRADSPLKPAADAVLVDTSDLTIEQVLSRILERVGKMAAAGGAS